MLPIDKAISIMFITFNIYDLCFILCKTELKLEWAVGRTGSHIAASDWLTQSLDYLIFTLIGCLHWMPNHNSNASVVLLSTC